MTDDLPTFNGDIAKQIMLDRFMSNDLEIITRSKMIVILFTAKH